MAYFSSTESSSTKNPPRLWIPSLGTSPNTTGLTTGAHIQASQGGALWYYSSTNLTTDLFVTDFFTDGLELGMHPGDMMMGVMFSSAGSSVESFLGTITGVSTSGATVSTGSRLTSTHD